MKTLEKYVGKYFKFNIDGFDKAFIYNKVLRIIDTYYNHSKEILCNVEVEQIQKDCLGDIYYNSGKVRTYGHFLEEEITEQEYNKIKKNYILEMIGDNKWIKEELKKLY